jgi:hypothetical protein
MYWPPSIDGAELMMALASLAEQRDGARDFHGLAESIDGNQRLAPCDQSSLVRDQLEQILIRRDHNRLRRRSSGTLGR